MYGSVSLGLEFFSHKRSRIGQREELSWDAVTTEASADPVGSSETGVVLQNYPKLRQGGQTFVSHTHGPDLGYDCPWGSECNFGKFLFTKGKFLEGIQLPTFSNQHSGQEENVSWLWRGIWVIFSGTLLFFRYTYSVKLSYSKVCLKIKAGSMCEVEK